MEKNNDSFDDIETYCPGCKAKTRSNNQRFTVITDQHDSKRLIMVAQCVICYREKSSFISNSYIQKL